MSTVNTNPHQQPEGEQKEPLNITLANQWNLYCQRVGLPESEMEPQQRTQLKSAFFGAVGQCVIFLRDEVAPNLSEDAGIAVMETWLAEVGAVFAQLMQEKQSRN